MRSILDSKIFLIICLLSDHFHVQTLQFIFLILFSLFSVLIYYLFVYTVLF